MADMEKKKLNKTTKSNLITYGMVLAAYLIVQGLIAGNLLANLMQNRLVPLCVYIILALSLNLTVGILGELSLGHAGFMCIGAFTSAAFTKATMDTFTNAGLRSFLALIIGAVCAGIFGFLIGILIYGYYMHTFTFTPGEEQLMKAGMVLPWALGLMFVGGAGKSAMFPLHIWLPDAMEGPTPVSALIHAATMVVAGVYLVARMFPLFIGFAPHTLHWVAYVGAFTAFYAASVACAQSDIKRVLAFSTISQIGFMMVALGVCTSNSPHEGGLGYMAGMFHLFTHAMVKA